MGLLAEKKIILGQVQEAYREATAATTEDAAAHLQDAAAIEVENVAQRSSISERAAASASIRILEGNLQGSTRAAGAFLATTLGLGPALQAAFPIIGAIALIEVLGRIPEAFYKMQDALAGWDKDSEKAFTRNIAEADHLDQVYERLAGQEAKIPIQNLEGPAKWKAEVESLEEYQQRVARLQVQFGGLKTALDAADSSTLAWLRDTTGTPKGFGILPEEAVHADAVRANIDKQLQQINEIRDTEARAYNQPLPVPLTLNFATSEATLKKQIDQMVEDLRKDISRRSEAIAEAGIQIESKAALEDTAAAEQRDRIARQEAESNKEAATESEKAWQAAYKEAVSQLTESERLKIDATDVGTRARVAAIDAAIKEENSKGLQETDFYRSLLTQREEAVKAELRAEGEARLKAEEDAEKQAEKAAEAAAARARVQSETITKAQQAVVVENKPEKTGVVPLDLSAIESQKAAEIAIAESTAQRETDIENTLTLRVELAIIRRRQAVEAEYAAGLISAQTYAKQVESLNDQVTQAAQLAATKREAISQKEAQEEIKAVQNSVAAQKAVISQLANFWSSEIDNMLFRSKNFHDAVTKVWLDLEKRLIEAMVRITVQHLLHETIQTNATIAANQRRVTSNAMAAAQTQAVSATSAINQLHHAAGVAAGYTYAAIAQIPFVGPFIAPGFAAAAYAAVLAFGAIAEEGWDVPSGGPFPTLLHAREMVLPAHLAEGVRSMSENGDTKGGGEASPVSAGEAGNFALHYHAGTVRALDHSGVDAVLRKSQGELVRLVKQAARSGAINPRQWARR